MAEIKRKRNPDLYEKWEQSGQLQERLDELAKWKRRLVTQKEMAKALGISEEHFIKLKKKHPEIQAAFDKGMLELKKDLVGAMYKKALGYEVTEEDQYIESGATNQKPKTKVHRTKRHIQGDYSTQVYLMNKFFGKEYNVNFDSLEVQLKKQEDKEVWSTDEPKKKEDSE